MNKYLPLLLVLWSGCQSAGNTSDDSSEMNTSAKRQVIDNVLISKELPEIEIKVDDEFEYVGSFDFEIIATSEEYAEDIRGKAIAGGDRFVFVSKNDSDIIRKLFIVQLEGFLPGIDFTYNYDFSTAGYIGENKYRHNTWFYNAEELAKNNPRGEGALTRDFLREKGYSPENEYMMSRFVGLASEDRKYEIIMYYIEMLNSTTGYSLEEYENTIPEEEAQEIRSALIERSRKSFEIIKG